jgi:hypothetical protein
MEQFSASIANAAAEFSAYRRLLTHEMPSTRQGTRVSLRQRSDYEAATSTYRDRAKLHAHSTHFTGGLQGIKLFNDAHLYTIATMDMTAIKRGC